MCIATTSIDMTEADIVVKITNVNAAAVQCITIKWHYILSATKLSSQYLSIESASEQKDDY